MSNAGSAATTAPKPTRLATLITGSADAFSPASTVSRSDARRPRLKAYSTTIAAPAPRSPTRRRPRWRARSRPSAASARKLVSRRGSTSSDIVRLTSITTISGSNATAMPGSCGAAAPCSISAGSNSCEVVARSRTTGRARQRWSDGAGPPKPSPARRAAASARAQPPQAEAEHDAGRDEARGPARRTAWCRRTASGSRSGSPACPAAPTS